MSTLKEPYRIEGKKTMGLELAEQFGWRLPDVIIYPTGGGTGLIGMWKAFDELGAELGWLESRKQTALGGRAIHRLRTHCAGLRRGRASQNRSPASGPDLSPAASACPQPWATS